MQEYLFKVTSAVSSSLISVLKEALNTVVTHDEIFSSETECSKAVAVTAHEKKEVFSSTCYKVANSTFYTDLPSERWRMGNDKRRCYMLGSSHFTSSCPALSTSSKETLASDRGSHPEQNPSVNLQLIMESETSKGKDKTDVPRWSSDTCNYKLSLPDLNTGKKMSHSSESKSLSLLT